MTKKHQILIIGHDEDACTPEHEKIAYDAGTEVAKSGSVLISGGLGGVMKAACKEHMILEELQLELFHKIMFHMQTNFVI